MPKTKRARVVMRDDMIFTGYNNDYTLSMDAAPSVGGHDAGMRPIDLMLISLGGCTAMDVISILRKKRQQVTGLQVEIEGNQRDEHPRIFTEIHVRFTVTGHDVDKAAVERSIELSRDSYCPASAILRQTATIHYDYEIVDAETETARENDESH